MSIQSKNYLLGGIGLFFFLFLGLYVKETQQYALFYREQQQLFLFDWNYLSTLCHQPGGVSVWSARFLVQFFYSPVASAAITTSVLALIAFFEWLVIRKIADNWYLFPLCFIPGLFLLISLLDNNYHYEGITAYLFMSLFLWIYTLIPRDGAWHRWMVGTVSLILLFFIGGAITLLFATCAFLYDWLKKRENSGCSLLYIVMALGLGWIAVKAGWTGKYEYMILPSGYYETMSNAPLIHYVGWGIWPVCMLLAYTIAMFDFKNKFVQIITCLAIIVAAAVCFTKLYHSNRNLDQEAFYRYEYYTVNEKWDELIKACPPQIRNQNDANYLNLALAYKGELSEKLFSFPQFGPKSLVYISEDKTPNIRLAHVLFAMGNMSAAQNVAFNACLPKNGYNPTMLKMILQIELMRGAYPVALKYIELMEKTWHYSEWATHQRKFLYNDQAINKDALLGMGRKSFPNVEAFVLFNSPMDDLYKILDTNPANKMAMQYGISYLLLAKDINHVKEFIDRYYGTSGLTSLPTPAQEALLFYADYYHTLDEEYAAQHGISKEQLAAFRRVDLNYCKNHGVTQKTIERFSAFKKDYGRNPSAISLASSYKQTFWYYLLFVQI